MTLIISMRIPDGIVLAGDSLATMPGFARRKVAFDFTCPDCNNTHRFERDVPFRTTASTLSYARKVFPFLGKYGIGTAGIGQLIGKTIYFLLRQLEDEIVQSGNSSMFEEDIDLVADAISHRALDLLKRQVAIEGDSLPQNSTLLEFQLVGYKVDEPVTFVLGIGDDIKKERHSASGINAIGITDVVQALLDSNYAKPDEMPVYEVFSLQDAIAYANYLISTTATQQRFSNAIPNVGGEIDIALITPFDNFTWIRQKSLTDFEGTRK